MGKHRAGCGSYHAPDRAAVAVHLTVGDAGAC